MTVKQQNLGLVPVEDHTAFDEALSELQQKFVAAGLKKPKLTIVGKFLAVLFPAFTTWLTTPLSAKAARLRAEREWKKEELRETLTNLIDKEFLPNIQKAALSWMESFLEGEYGTS